MSSSSTCSAQRAAANRLNAQHSTGPRTQEGKERSAQNASTHHAYAADLLQPGEPEPFFHAHREAILERLCPMDAVELCLAERVVSAAWRLRRLQSADHYLSLMEEADFRQSIKDQNQQLKEFHERNADDFDNTEEPLPQVDLPPQSFSPGFLIARAFRAPVDDPRQNRSRTNSPFERLLSAEQRLQGMMHRALKELRDLQSQRRDRSHDNNIDKETCPFLTPEQDEADDQHPVPQDSPAVTQTTLVQNEPTCHNGSPKETDAERSPASREDLPDQPPAHVSQAEISSLEAVSQRFVIESQQVQNRGVQVRHVDGIGGDLEPEIIARSD
jgi:hypothetical protein